MTIADAVTVEPFQAFFDDAAVFPPGSAPLDQAIREHLARRGSALATAVGPLVLPLSAVVAASEVASTQDLSSGPIQISVVTPAGELPAALAAAAMGRPHVLLTAVELKTSADAVDWQQELAEASELAEAHPSIQFFVELTAAQIADGALAQLTGTALRLKFRTGGLQAELFPSPAELAMVIDAAVGNRVPFKLTAGLHEAVRFTNPGTGFTHHGFLNIAVATAEKLAAREGAAADRLGVRELEAVLRDTDRATVAEQFARQSAAWRTIFMSFGTCSVDEPAESLAELDLFPARAAEIHVSKD